MLFVKSRWFLLFGSMLIALSLSAQEDAEKLRKEAQNPVASLISVPRMRDCASGRHFSDQRY